MINHRLKTHHIIYSKISIIILLFHSLTSCTDYNQAELQAWMKQERAKTPTTVKPISPPVAFLPVPYTGALGLDPFDDQKLKKALDTMRAASGLNALKPDLKRTREKLETYPLDGIKMLGYMIKQNKPVALLSASGELFNVAIGNYIGQDFGRVIAITEQEISFKELVQDGTGDWVERLTKLQLTSAEKDSTKESKK
jgi:type IV pilus assembly protein PilP